MVRCLLDKLNGMVERRQAVQFGWNTSMLSAGPMGILMVHSVYGPRGGKWECSGGSWGGGDQARGQRRQGAVRASVLSAALWRALGMLAERLGALVLSGTGAGKACALDRGW